MVRLPAMPFVLPTINARVYVGLQEHFLDFYAGKHAPQDYLLLNFLNYFLKTRAENSVLGYAPQHLSLWSRFAPTSPPSEAVHKFGYRRF